MMEPLKAEEALASAACFSLGSGSMKKDDARSLSSRWERIASEARAERGRERPKDKAAFVAILAGMGLDFTEVGHG